MDADDATMAQRSRGATVVGAPLLFMCDKCGMMEHGTCGQPMLCHRPRAAFGCSRCRAVEMASPGKCDWLEAALLERKDRTLNELAYAMGRARVSDNTRRALRATWRDGRAEPESDPQRQNRRGLERSGG